jgi:carboxyl-terminal processing protease
MKSMLKPLLALTSLMAAFYLSISYQYGDPGWQLTFERREAVAAHGDAPGAQTPAYDLKNLAILNRVVIHIKENYVDPSRINERKMLGAAIEEVQRAVAELIVDVERDDKKVPVRLTVRIDDTARTFELAEVGNLWQMSFKFKDIFRFIQETLPRQDRLQDIEYAAINGLLSTLDPHSTLLRPEDYREMKLSTRGKFGGLGIVISIRDSHLTIINPIDDTPAARAKLKAGDRITQIGLDSTVNMALSDAVDLMRGDPGTKIDIWVLRDGWKRPRKYTLKRANIKVKSVISKRLKGGVGMVRVRHFQNTTLTELTDAMARMARKGKLRGLVLDLRGNPGGLLDQAIKMSDLFVESGPLVTTVGYGDKVREPKMATRSGTRRDLPLVVLMNGNSASASEIVAGALKNHHRALLIGERTFGKGSVQVIYDNKDDSALKLTIAQYLTPGDLSIQSVGIVPHIETPLMVLEEDRTDLFASEGEQRGEKDLPAHLDHASAKLALAEKPVHRLPYLQSAELNQKIEDNPNEIIPDFETELARAIILGTKAITSDAMLDKAADILAKHEAKQHQAIVAALDGRGVDWQETAATTKGTPQATGTLTSDRPGDAITAGETLTLTATVENTGDAPYRQLRAISESDNPMFSGLEFIFGNVPAGETRTWKVPVELYKSALTRRDEVTLTFQAADTHLPEPLKLKVAVAQLPRPRFALVWRVDDHARGNGDGLLQPGEEAELVVLAQNVGEGKSYALLGTLRDDISDDHRDLFIKRGRVEQEDVKLAPGGKTELRFGFKVKADTRGSASVLLAVSDTEIRSGTSEKLELPVVTDAIKVEPTALQLVPRQSTRIALRGLYGVLDAPAWATATLVIADARRGDWFRVPTGEHTYAWVPVAEVDVVHGVNRAPDIEPISPKGPPVIQLSDRALATETRDAALTLDGEVLGDKTVRDMLIYVNNRKVFFKTNAGGAVARMRFSARVPLEEGVNRITLIARENDEAASRRTVIVHREAL